MPPRNKRIKAENLGELSMGRVVLKLLLNNTSSLSLSLSLSLHINITETFNLANKSLFYISII